MSLPPIEVKFTPVDHGNVMSAFDNIGNAAKRSAATTVAADKMVISSLNARAAALANVAKIDASGTRVGEAAARARAKAAADEADAFQKAVDKKTKALAAYDEAAQRTMRGNSAMMLQGASTAGGGGGGSSKMLDFGLGALKSAIDLAADSLKVFAGFVINDVIGAQLKKSVTATQFANRLEGVAGDKVLGALNGLEMAFGAIDTKKIESTFGASIDKTHDFDKALEVSTLALKAGSALGMDPEKIAQLFADKRGELSGMTGEEFSGYISALVNKTKAGGGDLRLDELSKMSNQMSTMVDRFNGPDATANQKAATDIGLTGLVVNASGGMKSGKAAFSGLENLLRDLETNNKTSGAFKTGTQFNDLRNTIPLLLKSVGGDLSKVGKDPGGLLGSAKFNETSLNFLRSLGLEKTYAAAEQKEKGTGEGAVKARVEEMMNATGDAGALDKMFKKVDDEPVVAFTKAMREITNAFAAELMPVLKKEIIPELMKAKPAIVEFAKALAKMIGNIDGEGLAETLAAFGHAVAKVAFGILNVLSNIPGSGVSKDDVKAFAKAAGVNQKIGDAVNDNIADKLANPEAHQLTGAQSVLTGIASPGDLDAQKKVERLNAMDAVSSLIGGMASDAGGKIAKSEGGVAGKPAENVSQTVADAIKENTAALKENSAKVAAQPLGGPQTPMSDPARLVGQ